jgi:hypothetical protein
LEGLKLVDAHVAQGRNDVHTVPLCFSMPLLAQQGSSFSKASLAQQGESFTEPLLEQVI